MPRPMYMKDDLEQVLLRLRSHMGYICMNTNIKHYKKFINSDHQQSRQYKKNTKTQTLLSQTIEIKIGVDHPGPGL
jgi:hypothetical protein